MEEKQYAKAHKLLLSNRRTGTISGVTDVISFDIAEILLETEQGMLTIKGADLHVNRLTLEKGEVDIEGRIDSMAYSEVTDFHKAGASIWAACSNSLWPVEFFLNCSFLEKPSSAARSWPSCTGD
ncbi:MAG: sporulation protein YabP [Anaerosacchariphilus sp.]